MKPYPGNLSKHRQQSSSVLLKVSIDWSLSLSLNRMHSRLHRQAGARPPRHPSRRSDGFWPWGEWMGVHSHTRYTPSPAAHKLAVRHVADEGAGGRWKKKRPNAQMFRLEAASQTFQPLGQTVKTTRTYYHVMRLICNALNEDFQNCIWCNITFDWPTTQISPPGQYKVP